jgi:hypothetical protein
MRRLNAVLAALVAVAGGCEFLDLDPPVRYDAAITLENPGAFERAFLDSHNDVRASTGPGLPPMAWSPDVAAFAQEWADELKRRTGNCDVRALPTPHRPGSGPFAQRYGENITWNAGNVIEPPAVVQGWVDERADYSYATNSCAPQRICGHYTQVVWADSLRLGCAVARCDGAGVPFNVSQIWVCNYDPPGNWQGERPY